MRLELARVRALCFDVDGTLNDTDDLWVKQAVRLLSPLRLFVTAPRQQSLARRLVMSLESPGNAAYHLLDMLGLDGPALRVSDYLSRSGKQHRPTQLMLIPNVPEMLQILRAHYPLAVISARDEDGTLHFLKQSQLLVHFQAVATSQTCRYTKPFPDPLLWAASRMGVSPEECLMIGDTTVDIRAGKAAGAQTIGVLCGFGTETELRRAGADLILSTTADLLNILPQYSATPATIENRDHSR